MKNRRRLTIESAPNAILMVDEQVQIVLVNTQTETRFGDDREGLLGQPLELLPNSSGLSIPTGSSATKA